MLQDALHVLAQEHHDLEQSLGGHTSPIMFDSDDDQFYDCDESMFTGSKLQRHLIIKVPGLLFKYGTPDLNQSNEIKLYRPDSLVLSRDAL